MVDKMKIEKAVRDILIAIGEDADREGLIETPARVAKMYEEIFSGLHDDPENYIKTFHKEKSDEAGMVMVKDIPFYSMCEHHLMPFYGVVHIGYIPNDEVVLGISKMARIVDCFAKRPQIQERLCDQIAKAIQDNVQAQGTAVMIEAEHMCMTMRGVKKPGAKTVTYSYKGCFKEDILLRQDFVNSIK